MSNDWTPDEQAAVTRVDESVWDRNANPEILFSAMVEEMRKTAEDMRAACIDVVEGMQFAHPEEDMSELRARVVASLRAVKPCLRDEEAAPTVALYTPAELLSIHAEEGTAADFAGPDLYPGAAPVLAFVAALMANGLSVEVDTSGRMVTVVAPGGRKSFAWEALATHSLPRLADELRRELATDGPAPALTGEPV